MQKQTLSAWTIYLTCLNGWILFDPGARNGLHIGYVAPSNHQSVILEIKERKRRLI